MVNQIEKSKPSIEKTSFDDHTGYCITEDMMMLPTFQMIELFRRYPLMFFNDLVPGNKSRFPVMFANY